MTQQNSSQKQTLSTYAYLKTILRVGRVAFRMAPQAAIVRGIDSIVTATLPIATAYVAALATTSLADAYAGDETAGRMALIYVLLTAAIGVVQLVWTSVSGYVSMKTRYTIESTVEDTMMQHFVSLPFELYDDKETVDLHEKAKRFSRFFSYIFDTIGTIVSSVFSVIGALIALTFVNVWLGIIVALAVIPGLWIQLRLARQQAKHWDHNITNRRRRYNIGWQLQEARFIGEMRVYGVVKRLIKLHASLRDQDEKARIQLELRTTWQRLAADVGETLVELGVLVWIVLEISTRHQPVGQFVYVQQLVSRAMGQAGALATELGRIDEDLANIVDYQRFMDIAVATKGERTLTHAPQEIAFDNVSFYYPKTDKLVLQDISLMISRGEYVAIVGENGAGKSTLIKLLLGLYQPASGHLSVDGHNLTDYDIESWHRMIGLLGQDFVNYYFATIRENILFGHPDNHEDAERFARAIKQAELESVVKPLPHGVDTFIERWMAEEGDQTTATELSGGQYQRLALARNFYRDSPIVILDEPTSAIDALAEQRIFRSLFDSDKTVITISHRLSTIKPADHIYLLKDGKIVEHGTYDELLKLNGEFVYMFESQIDLAS